MTECERLIDEGFLKKDFFKEEEMDGFIVSEKQKKIWAVLLSLLSEFDRVCKEHSLRYWLCYGSLLGAVRHHGFIPWDDDLDVMMPREDYNLLLTLSSEFKAPFFLQTGETDTNYGFSFCKLINLNTTCFSHKFAFHGMKGGLFIDVFPLDSWDLSAESVSKYERVSQLNSDNSTLMRKELPNLFGKDLERVQELEARTKNGIPENLAELNRIARSYEGEKKEYLSIVVCTTYKLKKNCFPRECFEKTVLADFNGLQAPIPAGYEHLLQITYGDYLAFPPPEKRGLWHEGALFDPDIPNDLSLKKYVNEKSAF